MKQSDKRQILEAVKVLERRQIDKAMDAYRPETRPTPKQLSIFADVNKVNYRFLLGGKQSSKSTTGAREISWLLLDKHPYWKKPDDFTEPWVIIVGAQNLTLAENELWNNKLYPFLSQYEWRLVRQGSALKSVVRKDTGDTIIFVSHSDGSEKNRRQMQGYVAHYVWLDEMPVAYSILEELQQRVQAKRTQGKAGFFLATFTPAVRNDRIRRIVESAVYPVAKKYVFSKFDNPLFANNKEEELSRLAGYSETEINTILYGAWSLGENSVYQFDFDEMTVSSLPAGYSNAWRHVESIDPASKSKTGHTIWAEDPTTGVWYLIEDKYIENCLNPDELIQTALQRTSGFNIVRRIADAHESWFIAQARKHGATYLPVEKKTGRNSEMIKNFQIALSSGQAKIGAWCNTFIDEVQSCRYSDTSDKIVSHQDYHDLDTAKYFWDAKPARTAADIVKPWHAELREQNEKYHNRLKAAKNNFSIQRHALRKSSRWL